MNHEIPQENFDRVKLDEEIEHLESLIRKGKQMLVSYDKEVKNLKELDVIISGLLEKANTLAIKQRARFDKIPESDEEWEEWDLTTEKIESLYTLIDKLQQETEEVSALLDQLGEEVGDLSL